MLSERVTQITVFRFVLENYAVLLVHDDIEIIIMISSSISQAKSNKKGPQSLRLHISLAVHGEQYKMKIFFREPESK